MLCFDCHVRFLAFAVLQRHRSFHRPLFAVFSWEGGSFAPSSPPRLATVALFLPTTAELVQERSAVVVRDETEREGKESPGTHNSAVLLPQ